MTEKLTNKIIIFNQGKALPYEMSYNKRLEEKYIQTVALDFLEDFYEKCSHNNRMVQYAEVYTVTGSRADGLIAWENAPNDVRVVTIEAKSAKTISNLRTKWDKEKVSDWNRLASELLLFLLVCLSFNFLKAYLVFEPALLILLFIALFFLRKLTLPFLQHFFSPLLKTASVFEQAAQYPGNEMWIAIGEDTFTANKTERLETLINQCTLRKFGLLEIPLDDYFLPKILVFPRFRPARKERDFLVFYKKGIAIRNQVYGETVNIFQKWRLSQAEKHYNNQNLFLSIAFTGFLGFVCFSNFESLETPPQKTSHLSYQNTTFSNAIPATVLPIIAKPEIVETPVEVKLSTAPSKCSMPFMGTKFILKDQLVATEAAAMARVQLLKKAGCPGCGYFWIPCSNWSNQQELWCVYAYNYRNNKSSIEKSKPRYRYKLRVADLEVGDLEIFQIGERE